ncbi:MAG: hypothetical protein U1D30_14820 [Planctomycetota bacterium]
MFARMILVFFTVMSGGGPGESKETTPEKGKPKKNGGISTVEQFQRALEKENEEFLDKLAGFDKKVQKAKIDPETKLKILDEIAKDRENFSSTRSLPKSDELIAPTLEYLEGIQPIVNKIEKHRVKQKKETLEKLEAGDLQRIKDLDEKLNRMIPGRDHFSSGSKWHGTRQDPKHAFHWVLTVEEVNGSRFSGKLRQDQDAFDVEGSINGIAIQFRTTQVLKGRKNFRGDRQFHFAGFLLEDRLIGQMGGQNVKGQPIKNVAVSLWNEGKSRRR